TRAARRRGAGGRGRETADGRGAPPPRPPQGGGARMTVPIGSIRLFDSVEPQLEAGVYRIVSSLELGSSGLAPRPADETYVDVGGPRFRLGPDEVPAVHPPQNARGGFGRRLPHVVLGRRTLPWERRGPATEAWL